MYTTLDDHIKLTTFEPHMHAAGVRMCMEAIWGGRTEVLNCAGYDHNWVKVYRYTDDSAPLLPKGTLIHITAHFDNTPTNKNVVDPRNWGGLGHRSIDNMAILIASPIVLHRRAVRGGDGHSAASGSASPRASRSSAVRCAASRTRSRVWPGWDRTSSRGRVS